MIDWVWMAEHLDELALRTVQHFVLAAIAIGVGFAISLALSLWAVRRRRVRGLVVGASSVLYTIPSLALFAALVPVTGLSILTAEVPLVLYTLLIFMRNNLAGLDAVAPDVIEAADAMGYSRAGRLVRVELPLALPLIVSGLRLASVSTIGLVTISGILGDRFGGLGFFIFEGYRRSFPTEIWFGGVPVIVLAIAVDLVLVAVQRWLTPWSAPVTTVTPGRSAAEVGVS
ncbi:MAG TPA: ABC transporter permease [Candidatus Deferrimicrobiaceae bacterium]|nr:ABC transporter permease [Candidatus Deferrimicrobiaceae bacterium]